MTVTAAPTGTRVGPVGPGRIDAAEAFLSRHTWSVWTATRILCVLCVLASVRSDWAGISGLAVDVTRLYAGAHDQLAAGGLPYRDFRFEYPPGVFPFLLLPGPAVSGSTFLGFYLGQMLLLDAAVTALLRRSRTPAGRQAAALWTAGGAGSIGLWLCRNDLPACVVVVAGGLALAEGRTLRSTAFWTLGVVAKLWPLMLLGVLAAGGRGRWRPVTSVLALAGGAVLIPAWALGAGPGLWADLVGYHGGRGVEIEATAALPTLLWNGATGGAARLSTDHGSTNLAGSVGLGRLCSALGVVALAGLLGYLLHGRRRIDWDVDALLVACCLAVAGSLLLAKVFSAQYLAWLVAVACVARARGAIPAGDGVLVVLAVGLTTLVYPLDFFVLGQPGAYGLVPALLLLLRAGVLGTLAVRWARLLHRRRPGR